MGVSQGRGNGKHHTWPHHLQLNSDAIHQHHRSVPREADSRMALHMQEGYCAKHLGSVPVGEGVKEAGWVQREVHLPAKSYRGCQLRMSCRVCPPLGHCLPKVWEIIIYNLYLYTQPEYGLITEITIKTSFTGSQLLKNLKCRAGRRYSPPKWENEVKVTWNVENIDIAQKRQWKPQKGSKEKPPTTAA